MARKKNPPPQVNPAPPKRPKPPPNQPGPRPTPVRPAPPVVNPNPPSTGGPGGPDWVKTPITIDPETGQQNPYPNQGTKGGDTQACESVKGAAPDGFRWEGAIVTNADGSVSDTCRLVKIEEDTSTRDAQRQMARDEFRSILEGMGFNINFGFTQQEINQLFSSIDSWISDGWADGYDGGDKLLMKFRTSKETKDIYAKRFTGMAALSARGQAMSEGEYIQLESSIRNVMSQSGIDSKFWNSFDDFGRFIAGGVSPAEVQDRIVAAKSTANPRIMAELREYYNIDEGTAYAYLLGLTDDKGVALDVAAQARSQQAIRDVSRNIQIGGYAEAAGFGMTQSQSAALAGTAIGQTVDPFDPRTAAQLQGTFADSRRIANRERVLSGIDQEAYTEQDTLLAVFGDEQKRLASERRAKRERARFSGSAGTAAWSLGVER